MQQRVIFSGTLHNYFLKLTYLLWLTLTLFLIRVVQCVPKFKSVPIMCTPGVSDYIVVLVLVISLKSSSWHFFLFCRCKDWIVLLYETFLVSVVAENVLWNVSILRIPILKHLTYKNCVFNYWKHCCWMDLLSQIVENE